ncbi:hypothetical protein [Streptomyces sp. cf386]|uniref:hypothetical protein n=1 Tax=Streptomyces sp. cf386 TaxID=1761904 RepID=UPI00210DC1B4|nr:hypothetical protein [Streptomyces sp. cf386]
MLGGTVQRGHHVGPQPGLPTAGPLPGVGIGDGKLGETPLPIDQIGTGETGPAGGTATSPAPGTTDLIGTDVRGTTGPVDPGHPARLPTILGRPTRRATVPGQPTRRATVLGRPGHRHTVPGQPARRATVPGHPAHLLAVPSRATRRATALSRPARLPTTGCTGTGSSGLTARAAAHGSRRSAPGSLPAVGGPARSSGAPGDGTRRADSRPSSVTCCAGR